jgi:DNA-binding response OmpR family regulator
MRTLLKDFRPGVVLMTPKEALASAFAQWAIQRGCVPLVCCDERTLELAASRPNTALVLLDHAAHPDALAICKRVTDVFMHTRYLLYIAEDPLLEEQALMAGADAFCALIPENAHAVGVVFARAVRLMRRAYLQSSQERVTSQLVRGPITIDFSTLAASIEGKPVALTLTEFRLLAYFMFRPNRFIPSFELQRVVIGSSGSSVYTHMNNLLKKLGPARHHFVTERNETYSFVVPELLPDPPRKT